MVSTKDEPARAGEIPRKEEPRVIDREVGDLAGDQLGPEPHLTYVRYDATLDGPDLNELGLAHLRPEVASLRQMAEGGNVDKLAEIGDKSAALIVQPEQFPPAFDISV